MPGRTWRDLTNNTAPAAGANPSPPAGAGDVVARAAQGSPRLAGLLEQRELLENRLRALTSGAGTALDAREDARFRVPSFAERQQQQREWESRRSELQTRALDLRRQARRNETPPENTVARSNLRNRPDTDIGSNVNQWLARRDSQRRSLRDTARDRLAKVSSQIDKYTKMAEAPMRAVRKIDRSWEDRQRQISGAMDRTGPYVDRSQRRLSTDTGGSGDIFERMQRNRRRALERRAEQRRQEERDEARRQRASRLRKSKEN